MVGRPQPSGTPQVAVRETVSLPMILRAVGALRSKDVMIVEQSVFAPFSHKNATQARNARTTMIGPWTRLLVKYPIRRPDTLTQERSLFQRRIVKTSKVMPNVMYAMHIAFMENNLIKQYPSHEPLDVYSLCQLYTS